MAEAVIVVGVDLEEPGDGAIRAALQQRSARGEAHLHLVFAVDGTALPDAFDDREFDSDEEVVERARELVAQRVVRLARAGGVDVDALRFTVHCALGKPVPMLLATCARYQAELLVVGTHGRRGFERLVAGSVAETLVREAPCDLLVARGAASPAR